MEAWYPKTIWTYKNWSSRSYGHQGWFLVAANLSEAAHQAVAADPEIYALPLNLDAQIGGNVATVQAALEDMKLPASWVNASHTYRQVMRLVYAVILLFQRVSGILNVTVPFLAGNVTLNSQFNSLPQVGRDALIQVAQEWNLDYSGLTGQATLRQILKLLADQMPSKQIRGITL